MHILFSRMFDNDIALLHYYGQIQGVPALQPGSGIRRNAGQPHSV